MGTRFVYNLKAFDNKILFNMPNDYTYLPFDLGPFLKVTGDQTNFKIAILNRGTNLQ